LSAGRGIWRGFLILALCQASANAELVVDFDFPGGSAAVSEIDSAAQRIVVNPSDYPETGWRCWWYFKITGIQPGIPVTLDVGDAPWATPVRAHFSLDNKIWTQTEPGEREGKRISYKLSLEGDTTEIWVAWGPPFVPSHAQALVDRIDGENPAATAFNLCDTRGKLATPAVKFGGGKGRTLIWFQARQHAWESGSSWVAKGLIDWLASDDPAAAALLEQAEIVVVPIMDIDNVHRGAGGKNQHPQDHNRDWSDEPHWNAVAAAQKHLLEADKDGRLALFVDLHNPGPGEQHPYFFVPPAGHLKPAGHESMQAFLAAVREKMVGPLRFSGKTIESGPSYDPKAWTKISKNWVATHTRDHVVAVTLETPWDTKASNPDGYETVGRQLGLAVLRFLESSAAGVDSN
jgi:hypothetical protein